MSLTFQESKRHYIWSLKHSSNGSPESSQEHLESIAQSGNVKVQYILAKAYYQQKNFDKAIHWFLISSEQKFTPSINYIMDNRI